MVKKRGLNKTYRSIFYILMFAVFVIVSLDSLAATNFTFQMETTGDYQNFSFQTDSAVNLSVDWGDGNNETFSDGTTLRSHNYTSAGTYNISLNGTASRISFYEGTPTLLKDILTPMSNSITGINSSYQMFRGCTGITNFTAQDFFDDVSENVTTMRNMFYSATSFNQNISTWNTSKVTTMYEMFRSATSFNQSLSAWSTSNVTTMYGMFQGATSFNNNISTWNTSKVTTMITMFYGATSFNQPLDNWDTSNVIDMQYMFREATAFNQPLNSWDTSKVTDMTNMFRSATSFNQSLSAWSTSNVTSMNCMFKGASLFNQDISNWNTSNVISMSSMFIEVTSFNQNISAWDTSKVTSMTYMFYGTTSFNQPLNTWNTSSVVAMGSMFQGATSFNQNISSWDVSKVTNINDMFHSATNFNQPLNDWDMSKVTNMEGMFNEATAFNQNLSNWDTSNVTNMGSMFRGATSFNQLLSAWNVSGVTTMSNMFYGVTLSTPYYNSLLIGWNNLSSLQNSVSFHGGSSKYSSGAVTARQNIIDTYNWTITDGGCLESWTCTAWSTCVSSVQTRTCTDANSCGTTTTKPAESQACTVSSPGSSPPGITADQPTETHTWDVVEPETPLEMEITGEEIDITQITVEVSETVTGVSIKVTEIDVVPVSDIKIDIAGDTYQSFKIETTGLNDTNIESATIEFKVNKTWVDEAGGIDFVLLYRKQEKGNKWDELLTTFLSSDDDYYYFSAVSPGFSLFTIVMDLSSLIECVPGAKRCIDNNLQQCNVNGTSWSTIEICEYKCRRNKCVTEFEFSDTLFYVIVVILSIGALVVIFVGYRYFSKKHIQKVWEKSKETERMLKNKK